MPWPTKKTTHCLHSDLSPLVFTADRRLATADFFMLAQHSALSTFFHRSELSTSFFDCRLLNLRSELRTQHLKKALRTDFIPDCRVPTDSIVDCQLPTVSSSLRTFFLEFCFVFLIDGYISSSISSLIRHIQFREVREGL